MTSHDGMTLADKKAAVDAAWARYRRCSQEIPRLPWSEFLAEDEKCWRAYVSTERGILAERTIEAA